MDGPDEEISRIGIYVFGRRRGEALFFLNLCSNRAAT
jgi:hypothetical protein